MRGGVACVGSMCLVHPKYSTHHIYTNGSMKWVVDVNPNSIALLRVKKVYDLGSTLFFHGDRFGGSNKGHFRVELDGHV